MRPDLPAQPLERQPEGLLATSARPQTKLGSHQNSHGSAKRVFYYAFLFLLFFCLLYLRRSEQLLHPQVWDEDGSQIIPGLLTHGLRSLFYPVNGYLILTPKVISAISLAISGVYYPLISTILTWIFIISVCIAISVSPTWLKGGVLLGIATLLIPTDPEAFGIPLYSFWWTTLLLFLVVLWDQHSRDIKWRSAFLIVGGLSSPMIFLITPFLATRAAVWRNNRRELVVFCVAIVCCCIQAVAMEHSGSQLTTSLIDRRSIHEILPKFIGGYLCGNFRHATSSLVWFAAGIFLAFLLLAIPLLSKRPMYLLLAGLWAGSVYLIARRVDLTLLHQHLAGPRYFFVPFILLSWFLVSILADQRRLDLRLFSAGLLFASVLNMLPVRTRPQRDFHWAEQLATCGNNSQSSTIAISWDGQKPWFVPLSQSECKALQNMGLINLRSPLP